MTELFFRMRCVFLRHGETQDSPSVMVLFSGQYIGAFGKDPEDRSSAIIFKADSYVGGDCSSEFSRTNSLSVLNRLKKPFRLPQSPKIDIFCEPTPFSVTNIIINLIRKKEYLSASMNFQGIIATYYVSQLILQNCFTS